MTSAIIKIIYLSMGAFLASLGIFYKRIKHKERFFKVLLFAFSYCLTFWGISTIFHSSEGYPPQWFFFITSIPLWIVVFWGVINIKK